MALALLLAFQLVATAALAARMAAASLPLGPDDAQALCLSDHAPSDQADPDGSAPVQDTHRARCDICVFAAQAGTLPAPQPVAALDPVAARADRMLPRAVPDVSEGHQPRQSRGPPLIA
ncbi:hypothetical protein LQG66_22775 [Bradyrhizobium ontarionense]|uniref:DUF2946 domain-containing protein n=1 Tax=Bradyrhizobium ontarionense TaxID=2898149 RepID=A0ABY3R489_9BRAD|nr:hypothetical protein [Bradyrhizobium sp. A19]UFZ02120.1 hypothetical protein LQG66_22775 [Bradyrhizobium sp. A19]